MTAIAPMLAPITWWDCIGPLCLWIVFLAVAVLAIYGWARLAKTLNDEMEGM